MEVEDVEIERVRKQTLEIWRTLARIHNELSELIESLEWTIDDVNQVDESLSDVLLKGYSDEEQ